MPTDTIRMDMEARRRELCRPPHYDGNPDEYTYVPESCSRKPSVRRADALKRELQDVERWLQEHPISGRSSELRAPDFPEEQTRQMFQRLVSKVGDFLLEPAKLFDAMITAENRRAHRDVHERFDAAFADSRLVGQRNRNFQLQVKKVVFTMLARHLKAVLSGR